MNGEKYCFPAVSADQVRPAGTPRRADARRPGRKDRAAQPPGPLRAAGRTRSADSVCRPRGGARARAARERWGALAQSGVRPPCKMHRDLPPPRAAESHRLVYVMQHVSWEWDTFSSLFEVFRDFHAFEHQKEAAIRRTFACILLADAATTRASCSSTAHSRKADRCHRHWWGRAPSSHCPRRGPRVAP